MLPIKVVRFGSTGSPPADPTALSIYNKLVEWWEHDEVSGTTLVGHHGGFDGTYSGSMSLNQTALASGLSPCVRYTANTADSLVPNNAALGPTADYAIMVWFRRDGAQAANAKILWKPTDAANGRGTYYLGYSNGTGKLLARFNSGSTYYDIAGATTIADATVYQAIFNKNTTGSQLFLNNASDGTQASGGAADFSGSFGVYQGEVNGSDAFVGYYSATALFNDPLDSTERAYLYNSGNGINYATLKAAAGF